MYSKKNGDLALSVLCTCLMLDSGPSTRTSCDLKCHSGIHEIKPGISEENNRDFRIQARDSRVQPRESRKQSRGSRKHDMDCCVYVGLAADPLDAGQV